MVKIIKIIIVLALVFSFPKITLGSTVVATDAFTSNTESPLATNWTTSLAGTNTDGCKGLNNAAAARSSSAGNGSYWDAASFDNNQYAQAVILDNTLYGGISLRNDTTADNAYWVFVRDVNRVRISDMAGSMTITTFTNNGRYTNGGTLKGDIVGYTITAYWNGSSQGSYTDTSEYADTGPPGVQIYGISTAAPAVDDFEAGNTADAGGTTIVPPPVSSKVIWFIEE